MRTQYEFTLPVPATVVWRLLADANRALSLVPGAEITRIGARSCTGSLRLRVRSISATYRGTAQLITKDDVGGVLAAQLEGTQSRGSGTLKADIEITVASANGSGSVVSITTEFAISGPIAETGGAAVEGAVDRLLAKFASNVQGAVGETAGEGLETVDTTSLPPVPGSEPAGPPTPRPVPADPDTEPAFAPYGGRTRRTSLPMVGRAVAAAAAVAGLLAAMRRLRRR